MNTVIETEPHRVTAKIVDVWLAPESAELETQLLAGEEVLVRPADGQFGRTQSPDGWIPVVCLDQPSRKHPLGYPGWVRDGALDDPAGSAAGSEPPRDLTRESPPSAADFLDEARTFVGSPYLMGGLSAAGIDCSGLVHVALRNLGIRVPRDSEDQHAVCTPVDLDEVDAGDLYFFSRPGALPHHVGIVTEAGRMLHAPLAGGVVVEEALTEDRLKTLTSAGRVTFA